MFFHVEIIFVQALAFTQIFSHVMLFRLVVVYCSASIPYRNAWDGYLCSRLWEPRSQNVVIFGL